MCYMSRHSEVGVRELRQNLSVYLARVKKGERLSVTERRQVVAVLAPVHASDDPLSRLVATGRAAAAARAVSALPRPMRLRSKTPLSQIVRQQSDDVA
jgi:antitoxin (DNA-binding transcriptional repressor) of toxin-antitoxin stability system